MKAQANMILPKKIKPWSVQRLRTKQGHIHATGKRINSGSHGVCSAKRRSYRRYAHRVTIQLNYSRARSVGYTEG